ncbi:MAG TPA: hypothetical protein VND93_25965 [Myxococcales bacterium]|nr:hypothetical protein [Myxococcales bacterium]
MTTPQAAEAQATATATATATAGNANAFQADLARDGFDQNPAVAAEQAQATEQADQQEQDPISQALSSLVDALSNLVSFVSNYLGGGDVGTGQDPAVGKDPLDNKGGGAGTNPLGIDGPGGPGTHEGAFGVVGIDQNDPSANGGKDPNYQFGETACGPTALAQIARGKSLEDPNYSLKWTDKEGTPHTQRVADMSNQDLVKTLGEIAGLDNEGVSPNGLMNAAAAMGLPVDDSELMFDPGFKEGQIAPSHSFNQQWLDQKLDKGEKVIINGAYEATDEHGQLGLVKHYMTIAGRNADNTYAVMDPTTGSLKNYTADQLSRFMEANRANGGDMIAIG